MKLPLFLSGALLLLTGCFEIKEEIDLNPDGSGRVVYTLNMSESKTNLANILRMGEVEGRDIPSQAEMEAEIAKVKKTFSSAKGITEVQAHSDFTNFVFTLSGRFDNVQNLDNALNLVSQSMDRTATKVTNYAYDAHAFHRKFELPIEPLQFYQLPSTQRYVLESARMISIYRFQKPILQYTNSKAVLAPTGKAIRLEYTLASLMKGAGTLENDIRF